MLRRAVGDEKSVSSTSAVSATFRYTLREREAVLPATEAGYNGVEANERQRQPGAQRSAAHTSLGRRRAQHKSRAAL